MAELPCTKVGNYYIPGLILDEEAEQDVSYGIFSQLHFIARTIRLAFQQTISYNSLTTERRWQTIMANILIVEDEKTMQDIIAEYMRKGGHSCFTAADGIDALVMLKNG